MNWVTHNQWFILIFAELVMVAALGWFVIDLRKKWKRLFGRNGNVVGNPTADFARRIARLEALHEEQTPRLSTLEGISKVSIQKVGFLRFNPFSDTGGDNSFVLALLDHENNGVVISSLYTRSGVRVYGKAIENGSSRNPLSEEENKILEETINK